MLSTSSLQSMLQEYYRGPVADQLNQEVLAVELFEKGSFTWAGKNVIIPLHTGRNTGVGYRNEAGAATGGALPSAGMQIHNRIVSNATFLYGRFELSGPTMASASKGGMNSFIGALDNEMTRLVQDIRNHANVNFFVGNECRGLINEKKVGPTLVGASTYSANPALQVMGPAVTFEYDGDFSVFDGTWVSSAGTAPAAVNGVAAGQAQNAVRIDLVRLDTYEKLPLTGNDAGIFVSGFNKSLRTIDIAGASSNVPGTPIFTTATVTPGVGIAVCMNQNQLFTAAVPANLMGTFRSVDHEPHGILQNLCDDALFNIARSNGSADGGESLQSTISTHVVGVGADARGAGAFDPDRLQKLLDDIDVVSGKAPNMWIMHNSTRQTYIAGAILISATTGARVQQTTSAVTASGLDVGYDDNALGYGGIKMRRSRHCPKGMFIALSTDAWKLAELKSGDFADLDGAILSRKANSDAWEGFWRWYHQVVCCYPNANGILFGFNLAT
tara:strand:+ start:5456 stop:6952 length:1497 start_codon:yes stop_codon:yes gene_type:complete